MTELQQRETQVAGEMELLQSSLKALSETTERLLMRLNCVTRDEPPSEANVGVDREALVELAQQVRDSRDVVQALHGKIESTLERLEL